MASRAVLIAVVMAVVVGTCGLVTAQAYDRSQTQKHCQKLHHKNQKKRDACITAESIAGVEMDGLTASANSAAQHKVLELCTTSNATSYQKQLDCISRTIARAEADNTCERARVAGDGSYQTKEACIKAEIEAMARLGQQ